MTQLAEVHFLPGVGDGPGERPATFTEYLLSIGLKWDTIRNYRMQIRTAERICAQLGADLLTAGPTVLAAISNQTSGTHSARGQSGWIV